MPGHSVTRDPDPFSVLCRVALAQHAEVPAVVVDLGELGTPGVDTGQEVRLPPFQP
jgi:hypothetical protein